MAKWYEEAGSDDAVGYDDRGEAVQITRISNPEQLAKLVSQLHGGELTSGYELGRVALSAVLAGLGSRYHGIGSAAGGYAGNWLYEWLRAKGVFK